MHTKASTGQRIGGYLMDCLIAIPFGLIWLIPIIGTLIGGALLLAYWLLRDLVNPSLGKRVAATEVRSANGDPATQGQLILRNLPQALPYVILMIPIIGWGIGSVLNMVVLVTEIVLVITDGRRMGDRLAGTMVCARVPQGTASQAMSA
jgi:uncharacterized RDD family membrane protein YckC